MECADSKVSMDNINRNKVSAVGTKKVSFLENYDIDTPLYNFFIKKYRTGLSDV